MARKHAHSNIEAINLNKNTVGPEFEHRNLIRGLQPPVVIALDPGETTGWSLIRVELAVLQDRLNLSNNIVLHQHGQVDCGKKSGALEADSGAGDRSLGASMNPIGEARGVARLIQLIDAHPGAAIVVEDFIPNFDKLKKDRAGLSPVRITARLEQELWHRNRSIVRQSVSDAKTTMTDERLIEMGRYESTGGMQHARDADRHALLFMRKAQNSEALRHKAWPMLFDAPEVKPKQKRKPKEPGTIIQFP